MSKIRFAIVGAGFRTAYFVRTAQLLKDKMEVTGILVRSEEKKLAAEEKFGVPAYLSYEELLADKPDFVVVSVNRWDNAKVVLNLLKQGVAVLAETPAADEIAEMEEMWQLHKAGAKLQVAEQYFLYPSYEAKLNVLGSGAIGQVHNITLSAIHEYHGLSIIRQALSEGCKNCTVTAKEYKWNVAQTQNRANELVKTGAENPSGRVKATFEFEDGKVAFYDFDYTQYNSHIREKLFWVQGSRGEIFNNTVRYLSEENDPMTETLTASCGGAFPGVENIAFAGKSVYRNPFAENTLPEDETAIARLLIGMKNYVDGGEEIYPLADALQDAYLTTLLKTAIETGETYASESQVWAE